MIKSDKIIKCPRCGATYDSEVIDEIERCLECGYNIKFYLMRKEQIKRNIRYGYNYAHPR